jgi:signal transduction histidine kinase
VRLAFALVAAAAGVLLVRRRYEELLRQLEESRMRIARAADLERSRIERDLHDGAQQRLIGLRIKLSIAEELSDPAPVLRELGTEVELALEELRQLAHGVYPSLLSDRGLGDALRALAAELPLPVHLAVADIERKPPEVETAVYFACREAAQNVLKHGASQLWIVLTEQGFEVRDDGPGFIPTGHVQGGLRNMRDRIEAIGGELTIDSAPGRGTRVRGVVERSNITPWG